MTETDELQSAYAMRILDRLGVDQAITYFERIMALCEQHKIRPVDLLCYFDVQEKGEADLVGIAPLMYTHAIVSGINYCGYSDRWCYDNYAEAKAALDAWDGSGEPQGWKRNPRTGRRRDKDGNEWVNW